jgi:hypothetical protein
MVLTALALVFLSMLLPGLAGAAGPVLTIGFLPEATSGDAIMIRGTAPRGDVVAISVNGELQVRVIAGPDMDVYHYAVSLAPGANRVTLALEGTEAALTRTIFRTTASFDDLPGHWAQQDIVMLATLGVVNGIGGGAFGPDLTLTRAQFAKLMVLGLGVKTDPAGPAAEFADGAEIPAWAGEFVSAAVASGLIKGYEDGTFRPQAPVSRVEMAVIAARGLRLLGVTAGTRPPGAPAGWNPVVFSDADAIAAWAAADVTLTVGTGVTDRYLGTAFAPARHGTRAEAAAMVRRLWSLRDRS